MKMHLAWIWAVPAMAIGLTFVGAGVDAEDGDKELASRPQRDLGPDQLEARFRKTLNSATMSGFFTVGQPSASEGASGLKEEKYTLSEVRKLQGDLWLFKARIQYGDHDVTVPLSLPVKWAGDTPVITLDNVPVPGLGLFSARVMISGDQYAGTWSGKDHGGHLFGRITRP